MTGRARAQCRKCRFPVKTMAMPAASATAVTSRSRTDPPGWMIAVIPAAIASSGPSANGKYASDASTAPARESAVLFSTRQAHRVDAAHLARADAGGGPVLSQHDRVGAHVRAHPPCEEQFLALGVGGRAPGHDLHVLPRLAHGVAVLYEHPAEHLLELRRSSAGWRRSVSSSTRRFCLAPRTSSASAL